MNEDWYEIALEVPREHCEAAAAILTAQGGFAGCEMRDSLAGSKVVVFTQATTLETAQAAAAGAAALLKAMPMLNGIAGGAAIVAPLDPEVWTQNWRRHFARHTIGGRIEIVPPWESASPPEAGLLSIVINPGMAFGTGLHETTSGCIEALIEHVKPGDRVLDLGCGSAILAITAVRLGAREALAIDNDPIAIEAALENIEGNAVADVVKARLASEPPHGSVGTNVASESDKGSDHFDIVVANILAETLVEMRGQLTVSVRDGGTLVLSGIEKGRLQMVLDTFVSPGWTLNAVLERGEWATVILHRLPLAPSARDLNTRS